MTIEKICNQYLSAYKTIQNYKANTLKDNLLAGFCVLSYLTLVIPIALLTISKLTILYGRVSKKTELTLTDQKVNSAVESTLWTKFKANILCQKNSQFQLAECYSKGNGVIKNEKYAVELYVSAAKKNHSEAMYQLGVCFENGFGVDKNLKTAFDWYKKAADNGNVLAQNKVEKSKMTSEQWDYTVARKNFIDLSLEIESLSDEMTSIEKKKFTNLAKEYGEDYRTLVELSDTATLEQLKELKANFRIRSKMLKEVFENSQEKTFSALQNKLVEIANIYNHLTIERKKLEYENNPKNQDKIRSIKNLEKEVELKIKALNAHMCNKSLSTNEYTTFKTRTFQFGAVV
jgi:hypothetical protein